MSILIKMVMATLSVMLSVFLLQTFNPTAVVLVGGWITALWVAVILGFINMFIKPVIKLLAFPINLMTLGLFSLVINGLLVLLITLVLPDFKVDGLWWAIVFSLVLSVCNWLLGVTRD